MRYGLQLRTLDAFADPRETVRVAAAAEEAGWEALLVWDHLAWASYGVPSADPWVTLGACADATSRIQLGTAVTPLPRRRPHVVAQQLASLSLASGGRVVFGAGLGGPRGEYERFGEDADERRRAAMLDEGLDVVAALLTGEPVDHQRRALHRRRGRAPAAAAAPDPVLDRRRLAARAPSRGPLGRLAREQLRRLAQPLLAGRDGRARRVAAPKGAGADFDVCFIGYAAQADLAAYAAAGVTWWIENLRGDVGSVLDRVRPGPPGETLP